MVHNVESILEETLPLLRKAEKLKLLTPREVRTIVKKRRDHEHLIRRRDATRQNFFRYAVFEKDVTGLIQQRSHESGLPYSEYGSLVGQCKLQKDRVYNRAAYRFPGDAKLWIHLAKDAIDDEEFKRASHIFAKAVSKCGGNPQVWLAAIGFHFDECVDPRTARVLAQRALRALPANATLWIEYFRMELHYLTKLTARRFAIGFDVQDPDDNNSEQTRDELEDGLSDTHNENNPAWKGLGLWEGGVPFAVLKGAVSKAPLNELHCVEIYKIACGCPLVPATLLLKMVEVFCSLFPACIVTESMKVGVVWDVATTTKNRNTARTENGINARMAGNSEDPGMSQASAGLSNDDQAATKLEDLVKQNNTKLSDSRKRKALLLLLESFQRTAANLKHANATAVVLILTRTIRLVEKTDAKVSVIQDLASQEGALTLQALKSYFRRGVDELGVSYEDIFTAVSKECLVPFRSAEQDGVLCMYFARDVDLSRVVTMCEKMFPLPPVSMPCLLAASKAILALMAVSSDVSAEKRTDLIALVRKNFRKACQLPEGKSNVAFWIAYIDFERRVAQDAAESSAVSTKAMRILNKLYHSRFLEELALQTLS